MNPPAIARLNYFNGQRLEAADFRLEQSYHVRIRRELNRALFTPGIGAGLEVDVKSGDKHTVVVSPGLALDSLGREIIVVEPREILVGGKPSKPGDPVTGNYLIIEYAEELVAKVEDGCAVQLGTVCRAREDLVWGAPSRILAEPKLSWQHQWPKPEENKIVLAQVELDDQCAVRNIRAFVRKYVGASKEQTVRAFVLEGEKDLDQHNPKHLYFHIAGGVPNRVALYLRGSQFSSLYYTELGKHSHDLDLRTNTVPGLPKHTHTLNLSELKTTEEPAHSHRIDMGLAHEDEGSGAELDPRDDIYQVTGDDGNPAGGRLHMQVHPNKPHRHNIEGASIPTTAEAAVPDHFHTITGQKTLETGANMAAQTGRDPRTFLQDLRVTFDNQDITSKIITQLEERDGIGSWKTLGDGKSTHLLSVPVTGGKVEGTREIDLLRLGLDFSPGDHWLKLSVPSGGGKVHYNLYVE